MRWNGGLGPLNSFRMGTGHQKTQSMIKGLELSAPLLTPTPPWSHQLLQGWGKQLEIELIISIQWWKQPYLCNETSIITSKQWSSKSLQVGEHIKMLGGWCTQRGHGISMPPSSMHTLTYASLSICRFWVTSFKMNWQSQVFSWVL